MDAEGSTVADVDRVLDEGFGVIFHSLSQALEAGALRSDEGPLVFPRESRFGENIIESKIREETGAIYHSGRRVVHFEVPDPELGAVFIPYTDVESLLDALDTGDHGAATSARARLRLMIDGG